MANKTVPHPQNPRGRIIKLLVAAVVLTSFSLLAFGQTTPSSSSGGGSNRRDSSQPDNQKATISITGVKIGTMLEYIARRENRPIICENAQIKDATFNIIPLNFEIPMDMIDTIMDSTLRMKGFAIIKGESIWKVVQISEAKEHPTPINAQGNLDNLPYSDAVYTQVIKLEYADAQQVSTLLGPLKGRGDATYIALPESNQLIITDYASNIKRIGELIKLVDQKTDPFQTEIRKLNYASAQFVKTNLDQYITALQSSIKQRPGVPITPPRVLFDDRTNSVIIIAQSKDMGQLIKMVDLFDSKPSKDTEYNIIKLTNTNADDVAKIVDAIFKQQLVSMQQSLKASEKNIVIQPEKTSNSLIITAPTSMYNDMRDLIQKLDSKRMQVLLEVVIAELTDQRMVQLGVELASIQQPGAQLSAFAGTSMGLSTPNGTSGKTPNIPTTDSAGGAVTLGLWKNDQFTIPLLLQASQLDNGVDLKAAPVLLTNDNAEASIVMSDMAPYFTKTYQGGGLQAQENFGGYVEADIKLKITPYISENNYVRLVIDQTAEQFLGTPSQSTPKTSRNAKTIVTVPDKDTVVIGGLTREIRSKTIDKVPVLGDIPLLGVLFRHTSDSVQKTHLCIFIKPYIMKETTELIKKTSEIVKEVNRDKKEADNKK